jgi:serine/threonine protein kinase/Flp pilus assembly protein TadD
VSETKVKELFQRALAKPASQRHGFLDRVCANNPTLRARVETLLQAHEEMGPFLRQATGGSSPPQAVREQPSTVIGNYKLLQEIGEGGFGVVYMAQQLRPIRRKVALKILKLGMDTEQVIARFEAERQALAIMDHPNIARVLDAGATETGRPFFVMELVKGVPITEYCDHAQLDTPQRLQLFEHVCHAIQHAHHKGVIHRDIKPTNILVTLHDGRPVPKVIDFGIAKATDHQLTEKTIFTEFRQMIGTPEYMAPEQAELSGLDVDTRADIYSLGVVLYELLTGTKPFDLRALARKGYEEILRAIREVEPPRPSIRLSTMGEEVGVVARQRHTPPKLLGRLIRGDLDWIVMKTLEKDRSRRYETANALAQDIQNFLHDRPVLASPPGAAYRLRKYLRRHRIGVSAATAILLALVVGTGLSLAGFIEARKQERVARHEADAADRARRHEAEQRQLALAAAHEAEGARQEESEQRKIAETSAKEANTVVGLFERVLTETNPYDPKYEGYTLREVLGDFARELGPDIEEQPEVEATMRSLIGRAFSALDQLDDAEPHLDRALELRRKLHGERNARFAEALLDRAQLLARRGRPREAEPLQRRALDVIRSSLGPRHERALYHEAELADLLTVLARYDEADRLLRGLLEIYRERAPKSRELVRTLDRLGKLRWARGDYHGAVAACREAIAIGRELKLADVLFLGPLSTLGLSLASMGRLAEAESAYEEGIRRCRKIFGDAHPEIAAALVQLSQLAGRSGNGARAESLARQAVAIRRESGLAALADALASRGDFEAAEAARREALDIKRKALGDRHPQAATTMHNLALDLLGRGQLEEADRLFRKVLSIFLEALGEDHPEVATVHQSIGKVHFRRNEFAQAEARFRKALEIRKNRFGGRSYAVALVLREIGASLQEQGNHKDAENCLRESLAILESHLGRDHPHLCGLLRNLGIALKSQRRYEEAEVPARRAVANARNGDAGRNVAVFENDLAIVLWKKGDALLRARRLQEAEAALRESLSLIRKGTWVRFDVMGMLGKCVAVQGRFAEAEPLLLESYEKTPVEGHKRVALGRLVSFYKLVKDEKKVAEWSELLKRPN